MKKLRLFIKSFWKHLPLKWSQFRNPNIIICTHCKLVLNRRLNASVIKEEICFKCHFKQLGGTFPLMQMRYQNFLKKKVKQEQKFDAVFEYMQISKGLLKNGVILERARRSGGLNYEDRMIVKSVREYATGMGMTLYAIRAAEMDGERNGMHGMGL